MAISLWLATDNLKNEFSRKNPALRERTVFVAK